MRKFLGLIVVFIIVSLSVWGQGEKESSTPQQLNHKIDIKKAGISSQRIEAIDSLLQSYVDQKKLNCVVGFVAKGGRVVYDKAFGWKDVENIIPATTADYYVLFSQTKAITTVAFMTLVEQGLVSIDDPVSKYFPEIPNEVVTSVNEPVVPPYSPIEPHSRF